MIKVSAPGKVHIIGEHSVVYSKPAIIAAISRRCYVTAEKARGITIKSPVLDGDVSFSAKEARSLADKADRLWGECFAKKDFTGLFSEMKKNRENALKAGIGKILSELDVNKGALLEINSGIPFGSGLGSSAALAVALTKAIAELNGKKLSLDEVNDISYKLEQYSHGTPSGGDNAACCFGNVIWFQKEPRLIKPVDAGKLEGFVIVYIKKPEKTTGELVQLVRNLDEDYRSKRMDAIGKATEEMLPALKAKDAGKIKQLINLAQKNLAELGVSCKEIDEVAEVVKSIGGAAKLCGAGGGGTMLCYHEDMKKLKEIIKQLGYEPLEVELGVEGIRKEYG